MVTFISQLLYVRHCYLVVACNLFSHIISIRNIVLFDDVQKFRKAIIKANKFIRCQEICFKLLNTYQSASHANHSTKTTIIIIICVFNNIAEALDKGLYIMLIMLDLSAAFDVVNHEILLRRLEFTYGFSDQVLNWFHSYLTDRSQPFCMGNIISHKVFIKRGVLQGSVLGALLYSFYSY